jgi:hypothetical protein
MLSELKSIPGKSRSISDAVTVLANSTMLGHHLLLSPYGGFSLKLHAWSSFVAADLASILMLVGLFLCSHVTREQGYCRFLVVMPWVWEL